MNVRFALTVILAGFMTSSVGCNLSTSPSKTIDALLTAVERGDVEKAETFFSSGFVSRQGIGSLKTALTNASLQLKNAGGIKLIKVPKEDVVGDVAEVTVEVTSGNGNASKVHYKLVKEQGAWKVDGVSSESAGQGNEPMHPESAVEDVVKWARDANASKLKDWIEKQPKPRICRATAIDRNTLPDELKYHDVDDAKVREQLLGALDPVIKLVGCSNRQGVILYKGTNVYAGNLDGGQIAISPGEPYFAGSPPDERIFHDMAELRIFLAREIIRQMIPLEKPTAGFNDPDMLLRRELKINFLAATISLVVDHDPAILDRVALDLDLYAKPAGVASGTQGVPSLQQIQDIFGAAKQDYQHSP